MVVNPLKPGGISSLLKANKNQRLKLKAQDREETSFTDPKTGKTFNMSFKRTMDANYFTYDRRAFVQGGGAKGAATAQSMLFEASASFHRAVTEYRDTIIRLGKVQQEQQTEAAQEPVEAPDYWSEEKTAARMFDFAVGLFVKGGDSDREKHLEMMVAGMEKGHSEAEQELGGLPEIARATVDLAKGLLTQWAEEADKEPPSPTNLTA